MPSIKQGVSESRKKANNTSGKRIKNHETHISVIIPVLLGFLTLALVLNVYLTFDLQRSAIQSRLDVAAFPEKRLPESVLEGFQQKGVVVTIIRDKECGNCFDPMMLVSAFEDAGGIIKNVKELDKGDSQGKELIKKYNLTKLPTVLLGKDALEFPNMRELWQKMGYVAKDGTLVYTQVFPPYYDVLSGRIRGLVNLTYIIDASCGPCYDVTEHKKILDRFSITITNENLVSLKTEEGKRIVEKYGIKKIPTIMASPEISAYPGFTEMWKSVGSVERDGYYVFRALEIFPNITYIDLETKSIVTVE